MRAHMHCSPCARARAAQSIWRLVSASWQEAFSRRCHVSPGWRQPFLFNASCRLVELCCEVTQELQGRSCSLSLHTHYVFVLLFIFLRQNILAWLALYGDAGCGGSDATSLGDMDPKPSSEGHLCCEIGAAGGSGKNPFPILLTAYGGGLGRQLAAWASGHQTTTQCQRPSCNWGMYWESLGLSKQLITL